MARFGLAWLNSLGEFCPEIVPVAAPTAFILSMAYAIIAPTSGISSGTNLHDRPAHQGNLRRI